jgi:hypothetical protein
MTGSTHVAASALDAPAERASEARLAHRDLAIAAVVVVGLSRLIEPPGVWLTAIFLFGAMALGTLQVLADEISRGADGGPGVPVESLILPSVAALACVGVAQLIPFGLWLAPALLLTGVVVARCVGLEARLLTSEDDLDGDLRTAVLVTTLIVAFLAFTGVAATIPGGLSATGAAGGGGVAEPDLLVLVVGDALIAGLLGYRVAALRVMAVRPALLSALTYAAAIAIGAAALRAMAIPQLVGPALLTLAFYLWDAFQIATPARRRDARWWWQIGLLGILGVVVLAWNLLLRG